MAATLLTALCSRVTVSMVAMLATPRPSSPTRRATAPSSSSSAVGSWRVPVRPTETHAESQHESYQTRHTQKVSTSPTRPDTRRKSARVLPDPTHAESQHDSYQTRHTQKVSSGPRGEHLHTRCFNIEYTLTISSLYL